MAHTTYKKIELADATIDQLREYAEMTLSLDISAIREDMNKLFAAIGTCWPNTWIMVPVTSDDEQIMLAQGIRAEAPVQQRFQGTGGDDDPIVELTIGGSDQPGGRDPVPVGHNGNTIVIQRKMKAAVPYRYFLNLSHAIRVLVEAVPIPGEPGKSDLVESEHTAYPFNGIHKMPSAEEIRDWHARTDNVIFP